MKKVIQQSCESMPFLHNPIEPLLFLRTFNLQRSEAFLRILPLQIDFKDRIHQIEINLRRDPHLVVLIQQIMMEDPDQVQFFRHHHNTHMRTAEEGYHLR